MQIVFIGQLSMNINNGRKSSCFQIPFSVSLWIFFVFEPSFWSTNTRSKYSETIIAKWKWLVSRHSIYIFGLAMLASIKENDNLDIDWGCFNSVLHSQLREIEKKPAVKNEKKIAISQIITSKKEFRNALQFSRKNIIKNNNSLISSTISVSFTLTKRVISHRDCSP